jgi:hypothetical protein
MEAVNLSQLSENFSLIASGEYGLKHQYVQTSDGVTINFHAGGYVEFADNRIMAVLENMSQALVWEIFPKVEDFRLALKRISYFLK